MASRFLWAAWRSEHPGADADLARTHCYVCTASRTRPNEYSNLCGLPSWTPLGEIELKGACQPCGDLAHLFGRQHPRPCQDRRLLDRHDIQRVDIGVLCHSLFGGAKK